MKTIILNQRKERDELLSREALSPKSFLKNPIYDQFVVKS